MVRIRLCSALVAMICLATAVQADVADPFANVRDVRSRSSIGGGSSYIPASSRPTTPRLYDDTLPVYPQSFSEKKPAACCAPVKCCDPTPKCCAPVRCCAPAPKCCAPEPAECCTPNAGCCETAGCCRPKRRCCLLEKLTGRQSCLCRQNDCCNRCCDDGNTYDAPAAAPAPSRAEPGKLKMAPPPPEASLPPHVAPLQSSRPVYRSTSVADLFGLLKDDTQRK